MHFPLPATCFERYLILFQDLFVSFVVGLIIKSSEFICFELDLLFLF
jgi:hypothetical protein